jgi:hypothetical protein
MPSEPLACRLLGHRPHFRAEGELMRWECARGCGMRGEKRYGSAADAERYAAALDRDERADLGKRAPLSMFVLRLARRRRA